MVGTALCLVLVQMVLVYLLPWPLALINSTIIAITFFLIRFESGTIVWLAFLEYWFLDLYAVTPFGVVLLLGTMSTLGAFWLYQYFFTNQSWYATSAMTAAIIIIYRGGLFLYYFTATVLTREPTAIPWLLLGRNLAWEVLLSGGIAGVLFFAVSRRCYRHFGLFSP